ncbi:hypothetical protein [Gracilibacillus alcaliphilus]|uniref:hypothetical protein n=1 Tax=Gracilibacillus alcaliphilus TaxID=1401441 RepID=UPI00195ADAD4|nr:hypothetical protein [Gracilibacillus alcaliphilus]MBM7675608.1 hypothetical protein [Gracilibacillus alcaliphilus]
MLRLWKHRQRQRSIKKVKPGDGHALKPYRFYEVFYRSLFYAKLLEEDGNMHTYAVHIDYFSEESVAELYRDGKHYATSSLPATFPVPGGVIEAATTTYGVRRMHYVTEDGEEEHVLTPDRRSAEGLRKRFDASFPQFSSAIGVAAIVILLISLVLGLPQLASLISHIPFIADRWGSFEAPFMLPDWLNVTLVVAATIAALERALMLRNHWLIDMETSWWDE